MVGCLVVLMADQMAGNLVSTKAVLMEPLTVANLGWMMVV